MQRGIMESKWILPAFVATLALLGYLLAFKNTIRAWQENTKINEMLATYTTPGRSIGYDKRRLTELGQLLGRLKADTAGFRSNTLSQVAEIAGKENVKLTEVPAAGLISQSRSIRLQKLSFEGDYFALLKALYRLEHAAGTGFIRSVALRKEVSLENDEKPQKMILDIYLETF
ncbi:MAG TPA: hypothetical protein VIM89_08070 [Mucilaginibacter sp.]